MSKKKFNVGDKVKILDTGNALALWYPVKETVVNVGFIKEYDKVNQKYLVKTDDAIWRCRPNNLELVNTEETNMNANEQNYTKDYSLLRKFNLEAAKNGEEICNAYEQADWDFIAGIDAENKCVLLHIPSNTFVISNTVSLRMKPLAWVEGKPVYKGAVLWYNEFGFSIEVTGNNDYDPNNGLKGKVKEVTKKSHCCYVGGELTWAPFDKWSWNKPKVKREGWINVYKKHQTGSKIYVTKEEAYEGCEKCFSAPADDYITTIRIEWEE